MFAFLPWVPTTYASSLLSRAHQSLDADFPMVGLEISEKKENGGIVGKFKVTSFISPNFDTIAAQES